MSIIDFVPDYCKCRVLILGCGNVLFGDDGFGCAVVEYLEKNYKISEDVCIINAGISVREILFTICLSDVKPKKIIIIDAVDVGREPGEIFRIDIDSLPVNKIDNFSMHQAPTSNLLKELKDFCKIEIEIFVVQVKNFPDEVSPGLSETLINSIPKISEEIIRNM